MWHYLGILIFVVGMIFMGFILLLNRSPQTETERDAIHWLRILTLIRKWLSKTPVLVILGLIGLFSLGVAIGSMNLAFFSQLRCSNMGMGIPCFINLFGLVTIEALFLHQLADVLVAIGLLLIFLVVIGERSED
jgi:threonine/homoserine efflux transporter RhtA